MKDIEIIQEENETDAQLREILSQIPEEIRKEFKEQKVFEGIELKAYLEYCITVARNVNTDLQVNGMAQDIIDYS